MRMQNVVRIAAKAWLVVVSAFWGFMLLGYAIGGDPYAVEDSGSKYEGIVLGILMTIAIASSIYTLKNEAFGTKFLIIVGVLLMIFAAVTAGSNQIFAMAVSGGVFIAPALVLMLTNYVEKK